MATRYWVGGTGTWNLSTTTNWSTTSGGAGGASVPLAYDPVVIDGNSNIGTGAFTITINGGECNDCTINGLDGPLTITVASEWNIYGGVYFQPTNITIAATGNQYISFKWDSDARTKTIYTNGIILDCQIAFNSTSSWQLVDNLTVPSTRTILHYNGTLNLNNNTLSCGIYDGGGPIGIIASIIGFGTTGNITVTGNGATIFSHAGSFTGTPTVNCTYSGATGTRTLAGGLLLEATSYSFNITAGTDTINTGNNNNTFKNLNFTGFSGIITTPNNNGNFKIFGNLTIPATVTSTSIGTITLAATSGTKTISITKLLEVEITLDGVGGTWQLIDDLTLGSSKTVTLTRGTLDLNNKIITTGRFSSSSGFTRTIAFGTSNITLTSGGTNTIWTTADLTGLTITGTPLVNCTYSGAVGTRTLSLGNGAVLQQNAISVNITAGTDIIAIIGHINDLNFTGFSGTFDAAGRSYIIRGSLTLSSGMTWSGSGAQTITFAAASGTKTITSSGKTISNPIYFQSNVGVGANDPNVRWQLGDAFITNQDVTLFRGNFDAVSYNFTCLKWSADNLEARGINMGSGTWTITGSGVSAFTVGPTKFNNGNNALTLNSNNSTISFTNNDSAYLNGNNQIFNNLNINSGSSILRLNGNSTFNIIKNVDPRPTLAITGGAATTVITVGFLTLSGNTSRQFQLQGAGAGIGNIKGTSPGTTHSLSFCNVSSMNVSVGIFYASNTYGNKNIIDNTGWKFDAFDPVVSTGFLNF